jgi:hypothetical protein
MSDDELMHDVRNWLNQNGYVLEMEVARELMPHCSLVVQGFQFNDPITDKLRETDVFCEWMSTNGDIEHSIEMVIECKSTTAPWIAFYGGSKGFQDAPFPFRMLGEYADCSVCDDIDVLFSLGPGSEAPIAYSILEKKSAKSDRDLAREAVLAVTSTAVSVTRDIENDFEKKQRGQVHVGSTILPVVVTRSPIFACSLDQAGEVNLSRADSCWVHALHEKHDLSIRVLVINYSAFKTLVTELVEICGRLGLE